MPDTVGLSCQELVELVTEYLEGTLSAGERARFDAHLATCPHCSIYLEQMRRTIAALGHLPAAAVPPAALEALQEHFRRWKEAE
ncbi:MAG TPA: zf-HC2 domain-containing protein [Gemmatimonadales bacterium]|nr:zf-HC2 domain-containing protein [Gemmatimonadales bacterium]